MGAWLFAACACDGEEHPAPLASLGTPVRRKMNEGLMQEDLSLHAANKDNTSARDEELLYTPRHLSIEGR